MIDSSKPETVDKPFRPRKWTFRILLTTLGVVAIAAVWSWSGYSPSLRIEGQNVVIAFSPDGKALAVSEASLDGIFQIPGGPIRLVNTTNGKAEGVPIEFPLAENPDWRFPRPVLKTEFSPDGSLLVVLRENRDIQTIDQLELFLFDRSTGKLLATTLIPYERFSGKDSITKSLFSRDGSLLVWCESKLIPESYNRVVAWDVQKRRPRFSLPDLTYPVVSPDSRWIAASKAMDYKIPGSKASIQLWDTRTGGLARTIETEGLSQGWLPWPSFSPDSRWLAVNSRDNGGKPVTEVFEVETGRRVFRNGVWSPHFLGDGQTLATVKNNDVQLWDTKTWTLKASVPFDLGKQWASGEQLSPEPVAIPGGSLLAVFSDESLTAQTAFSWLGSRLPLNAFGTRRMTLIDGSTGENHAIVLNDSLLSKYAWSPDGRKMAIAGFDGAVSVWEIPPGRSWRPLAILLGVALLGLGLVDVLRRFLRKRKGTGQQVSESLPAE